MLYHFSTFYNSKKTLRSFVCASLVLYSTNAFGYSANAKITFHNNTNNSALLELKQFPNFDVGCNGNKNRMSLIVIKANTSQDVCVRYSDIYKSNLGKFNLKILTGIGLFAKPERIINGKEIKLDAKFLETAQKNLFFNVKYAIENSGNPYELSVQIDNKDIYVLGDSTSDSGALYGILNDLKTQSFIQNYYPYSIPEINLSPLSSEKTLVSSQNYIEIFTKSITGKELTPGWNLDLLVLRSKNKGSNYSISGAKAIKGTKSLFALYGFEDYVEYGMDRFSLTEQVNSLKMDHPKIGIDDIVIISVGGNDVLSSIYSENTDNIDKAIESINANLNTLYLKGVRSFIVSNVPDFKKTPLFYNTSYQHKNQNYSIMFNEKLKDKIYEFKQNRPDVIIKIFDLYKAVNDSIDRTISKKYISIVNKIVSEKNKDKISKLRENISEDEMKDIISELKKDMDDVLEEKKHLKEYYRETIIKNYCLENIFTLDNSKMNKFLSENIFQIPNENFQLNDLLNVSLKSGDLFKYKEDCNSSNQDNYFYIDALHGGKEANSEVAKLMASGFYFID
ncbi:hypothetical protein GCL60_11380 [Silvanigrella paludirubra]|uniref:SGNH hydrolase-type esterase domain-containing protein n=1 Tax=Silvanigrella paludirubra TaxID=2499159 RepID=A0A6N6VRY6_9BACT|nr:SGNH/GDSL hydrolase family protein [Silvanigrella paludirubra]KAB8037768.1 hypothetical protein GCL60_11380 [Silvanigrella paludirubra]